MIYSFSRFWITSILTKFTTFQRRFSCSKSSDEYNNCQRGHIINFDFRCHSNSYFRNCKLNAWRFFFGEFTGRRKTSSVISESRKWHVKKSCHAETSEKLEDSIAMETNNFAFRTFRHKTNGARIDAALFFGPMFFFLVWLYLFFILSSSFRECRKIHESSGFPQKNNIAVALVCGYSVRFLIKNLIKEW